MWLNAYGVPTHHVYFGTNKENVAEATSKSPQREAVITDDGSVYYLTKNLQSGITCYWRVDAESEEQIIYRGDVWSFQTV